MCADLENGLCAGNLAFRSVTESGVEKARVVDVELTHGGIVGDHFSGMIGRNPDFLFRRQQIKLVRFQNEVTRSWLADELPEIAHFIVANLAEVDGGSVLFCLVGDDI